MKYEKGQPTVRGRNSVIHADILLKFKEKHQLDDILPYLVENNYKFEFECMGVGDSKTVEEYTLTIFDICWAVNGTELFQKLEELDFNQGE